MWDAKGRLVIIDRKKNIFKLSQVGGGSNDGGGEETEEERGGGGVEPMP